MNFKSKRRVIFWRGGLRSRRTSSCRVALRWTRWKSRWPASPSSARNKTSGNWPTRTCTWRRWTGLSCSGSVTSFRARKLHQDWHLRYLTSQQCLDVQCLPGGPEPRCPASRSTACPGRTRPATGRRPVAMFGPARWLRNHFWSISGLKKKWNCEMLGQS